jgi:hypothetical protein
VLVAVIQWIWARKWFDAPEALSGVLRVLVAAAISGVAMAFLIDVVWWPLGVALGLVVYVVAALATGALSRQKVDEVLAAVRGGGAPA